MRVRFLSELEMAEGKERAVNTGFEGQSRIQEDYQVENTSYPAGVLSSPPSLPMSFSQDKGQPPPLKPHSPGVSASGVVEEHCK